MSAVVQSRNVREVATRHTDQRRGSRMAAALWLIALPPQLHSRQQHNFISLKIDLNNKFWWVD
ncbi:hypothetical protein CO659_31655 [Rhizobium sp. S9]|nr:hypothetical protein CO659_31655 [Rhizobium sp. S9]